MTSLHIKSVRSPRIQTISELDVSYVLPQHVIEESWRNGIAVNILQRISLNPTRETINNCDNVALLFRQRQRIRKIRMDMFESISRYPYDYCFILLMNLAFLALLTLTRSGIEFVTHGGLENSQNVSQISSKFKTLISKGQERLFASTLAFPPMYRMLLMH
uniref:Uncharacterized protein n=1 Tax=Glossina brevipalpis TaxID=37001 RepID=A0A1A9VZY9_9MUSC